MDFSCPLGFNAGQHLTLKQLVIVKKKSTVFCRNLPGAREIRVRGVTTRRISIKV
jgi:hypothetical protein